MYVWNNHRIIFAMKPNHMKIIDVSIGGGAVASVIALSKDFSGTLSDPSPSVQWAIAVATVTILLALSRIVYTMFTIKKVQTGMLIDQAELRIKLLEEQELIDRLKKGKEDLAEKEK